ncbi:hypothetical protein [Sodalis glossinidius]|uniref:hypothetical protein n=1 Tax=Sodalis glossinidius TaxID=63612 RepID=UPI0011D0C46A
MKLQGQRVLVTSGTKGVGKAVVQVMQELCACLLTTARNLPVEMQADFFVTADLTTQRAVTSWRAWSIHI